MEEYLESETYRVDESLRIIGEGQKAPLSIPLSWCNRNCGGFRFQPSNYGNCRGRYTCCHKRALTRNELTGLAARYVRRCPVCDRFYVGGGGRAAAKIENAACSSPACRLAWATANPSEENVCAVCHKTCLNKFTVTTGILPHLYPFRLFVGGEVCLCPGDCLAAFRKSAGEDLKSQAREIVEAGTTEEIKGELVAKGLVGPNYKRVGPEIKIGTSDTITGKVIPDLH